MRAAVGGLAGALDRVAAAGQKSRHLARQLRRFGGEIHYRVAGHHPDSGRALISESRKLQFDLGCARHRAAAASRIVRP